LAKLQQFSAKLLTVADARQAIKLINAKINELLKPLAFILLALTVGARVSQQLF